MQKRYNRDLRFLNLEVMPTLRSCFGPVLTMGRLANVRGYNSEQGSFSPSRCSRQFWEGSGSYL